MTKKLSTLALMACLASSLAFAGAQTSSTQSADDTKAAAAQMAASDNAQQNGHGNSAKNQHQAKPAPSTQEQEFDKVLWGIFG